MTHFKIASAALILAMSSGFAFAVEDASKLPTIKDGQCFEAGAAEAAQDQSKCRAALGSNSGDDTSSTTGATDPNNANGNNANGNNTNGNNTNGTTN